MRVFIAVDVDPSPFLDDVKEIKRLVKGRASFVNPSKFHVTLQFLGDVESTEEIEKDLESLGDSGPFPASVEGIGAFPSVDRPRVLWIGMRSKGLVQLAKSVRSLMTDHGFRPRRKFKGHLTLARARGPIDVSDAIDAYSEKVFSEFNVEEFCLKESILMRTGSVYRTVKKVKL